MGFFVNCLGILEPVSLLSISYEGGMNMEDVCQAWIESSQIFGLLFSEATLVK